MTEPSTRSDSRVNHLDRIAEARAGDGARKVPYPIGIRELEVIRTHRLSPSMVRLTLGGSELDGFESHVSDEHIRLIFPDPDSGELRIPTRNGLQLDWPRPHPPSRVYTVRRHDPAAGELDVDVVLHPGGLAAEWARRAVPGDRIHVAGPPGGRVVPEHYDRYLLAGDLTALPAIGRWLEDLPETAAGWAFIEVANATEEIELVHPRDVAVQWLHHDPTLGAGSLLADAVMGVRIPAGEALYVWMGGEAGALAPLHRWARDELGLGPGHRSITGYWKRGISDFDEEDD
jgi:NADPH-dependent ferric siderophore reductase